MSKRILSVILLICMLVNNLPVAAFAEESTSGCSHVCDENCGYVKAVACDKDCPAGEAHAEDCAYQPGSDCTHQHNGQCGVACTHAYAEGVCTVCGMAEPQPCEHTGGEATCEVLAVCELCKESYGDLADHVYEEGKCACGDVCEHTFAEGICTVCGMEEPETKPVCTCDSDDPVLHAPFCDLFVRSETPVCDCRVSCLAEERNRYCEVCYFNGAENCTGGEESAVPYTAYELWVAGVQVTGENLVINSEDSADITSGSATYDPDKETLTLNNFSYSGTKKAIDSQADLNIIVKGTNAITAACGVAAGGDLTITGENGGTLSVNNSDNFDAYGIFADSVSINTCTVTVNWKRTGYASAAIASPSQIAVTGSVININQNSVSDCGIFIVHNTPAAQPTGGIKITESTVNAKAHYVGIITDNGSPILIDHSTVTSGGISTWSGGDITIRNGSTVNSITDGECAGVSIYPLLYASGAGTLSITDSTLNDVYTFICGDIDIENSAVTVNGKGINAYGDITICDDSDVTATGSDTGIWSKGKLSISGSIVTASAKKSNRNCYGIECSTLEITGSKVSATGGTCTGELGETAGIRSESASITDSNVTATGGTADVAKYDSYGIAVYPVLMPSAISDEEGTQSGLTISGSSTVTAIGGTYGILGNVALASDFVVYAGETAPGQPADASEAATYENKYVKIEPGITRYDLWVGGVQVTSENLTINSEDSADITSGSATYDPDTNTLTLNGFSYTGEGYEYKPSWYCAAIYFNPADKNAELTIELVGTNTVIIDNSECASYAIYIAEGNLIIEGNGSLTATGDTGIYAWGNISISGENTSVIATGNYGIQTNGGDIDIDGGKVEANGFNNGIVAYGNISISGGEVRATATSEYGTGIYAEVNIDIDGSKVEANGGYGGIYADGNIDIDGDKVDATGSLDYGIYAAGPLTINGGIVTVKGSEAGIYVENNITIDSGTVKATASGKYGIGIVADSVVITGGTVTVTAQGEYGYGITTYDGLTLPDSYAVYAGETYPGEMVVTPADATYLSKYVKIAPLPPHVHCVCGEDDCTNTDHNKVTFRPWNGTGNFPGGNVYLTGNVDSELKISSDVNLCLNGHNVKAISISSGAALDLTDCTENPGTIADGIWVLGSLHLYKGNITSSGPGVMVNQASFTMDGGTISGCKNGGVSLNSPATFTMNGGTISDNQSNVGAGVGGSGTFTMNGGKITRNKAASNGGGVRVKNFTMNGGEITRNTAETGAGVFIYENGTLNISGNPVIKDNTGGNVYLGYESYYDESAQINVTDQLDPDCQISLTMEKPGMFLWDYRNTPFTYATAANFTSESKDYKVFAQTNEDNGAYETDFSLVDKKTITVSNDLEKGTVNAPQSAFPGETVTFTVIPKTGHAVDADSVAVKYGRNNKYSVGVSKKENGTYTFTMPNFDVEINATFQTKNVTITFDTDGGTPIAPITKKYGETIPALTAQPDKTGYIFAGWTPAVPATMPAEDLTVKALWNAITYTITYAGMDGAEHGTSHPDSHTYDQNTAVSDPTRTGYTFAGWQINGTGAHKELTLSAKTYTADIRLTATWTPNTYNAIFNANDGAWAEGDTTKTVPTKFGQPITAPAAPGRTGYTFAGWEPTVGNMDSVDGKTFNAQWTANTYHVAFNANGGDGQMQNQTMTYDVEAALSANGFSRTGYTFTGWAKTADGTAEYNDNASVKNLAESGIVTLYAKWKANTYKVAYEGMDGADHGENHPGEHTFGTATVISNPNKTGYTFDGWKVNGQNAQKNLTLGATDFTDNITLTATWSINQYTITFDSNGGSAVAPITQDYNSAVTAPGNPTREGYTFTGWDKPVPATMPAEDVALTAQWSINQYTITFDSNGGSAVAPITQDYNSAVTAPGNPTREGYTFTGWTPAVPATMPAENVTITAQWSINQYTITFDSNGGSMVAPIIQDYNSAVTAPGNPTREGYTFTGWTPAVPATMPAEDVALTAQWSINQYTITFDSNGGSAVAPITQDYNSAVTAPGNPTREGYTFTGWTPAVPATMPAKNVTITAQWSINQYTITFDSNGGSTVAPITQDYNSAVTAPGNPTREGYTFTGWTPAVPATMPAKNVTITAQWSINQYTITFDSNGGSAVAPITQDYNSAVTAPGNPTREGYTFTGWTPAVPATMPAENVTITAQWSINQYTITFDSNGGSTVAPITQDYNSAVTAPGNPTREGYTFTGWTPAVPATMPAKDVIITAHWTPNVTVTAKALVYNGESQILVDVICPEDAEMYYALCVNANERPVDDDFGTDSAEALLAGDYYVWYYTAYDNTKTEVARVKVTIAKATYDMSNAKWDYTAAFNYDGLEHKVSVVGLPNGVTAESYTGNAATTVGEYTAAVILSYDADNYNIPTMADLSWAIVNNWQPTEYTVTALNGNGYSNTDFVVTPAEGYSVSYTNTAEGVWADKLTESVETADGSISFYLKNNATGAISLAKTLTYKLDKTNPTGKVEYVERSFWQEFINGISFGLFYKTEVTVKAEAADNLSGVDTVEYAASDKALTLDEVKAISSWQTMPQDGISVELEDAKKFVYFVKITDKAGNVTYLSSNGAEYDTTCPVIEGIENGAVYYTTQVATVVEKHVDTVTLNGSVAGTSITLEGNRDTTYTIQVTDKAGNTTSVTVTMKPIDSLDDSLQGLTVNNVTSDHKAKVQAILDAMDAVLEDSEIPDDEHAALTAMRQRVQALMDAIVDAAEAIATEEIRKVENKTESNVKLEDKEDLKNAKEALETALNDERKGNYTQLEQEAIRREIERLAKAIETVEQTETVIDAIQNLPGSVEPDLDETTEKAIRAAKAAFDALNDYQKTLVSESDKVKLETLFDTLDNYEIIKGNRKRWESGSGQFLQITANGPVRKFKEVRVNGKVLEDHAYTVKEGSTIITLHPAYLQTLPIGKHNIQIVYTDGATDGKDYFQICASAGNPVTGENADLLMLTGMMLTTLLGVVALLLSRKKFLTEK